MKGFGSVGGNNKPKKNVNTPIKPYGGDVKDFGWNNTKQGRVAAYAVVPFGYDPDFIGRKPNLEAIGVNALILMFMSYVPAFNCAKIIAIPVHVEGDTMRGVAPFYNNAEFNPYLRFFMDNNSAMWEPYFKKYYYPNMQVIFEGMEPNSLYKYFPMNGVIHPKYIILEGSPRQYNNIGSTPKSPTNAMEFIKCAAALIQ